MRHMGPPRKHILRFLRFLRNDLSVNTSDWGRWLDQVKDAPARSKSSSKLPSLCSTRPHINGFLDKLLPTSMERATCMPGGPVSHHHSQRTECTYSLMQLRKKRNKRRKEQVWRSSTGASGLLR
jgi:hypothetical protein